MISIFKRKNKQESEEIDQKSIDHIRMILGEMKILWEEVHTIRKIIETTSGTQVEFLKAMNIFILDQLKMNKELKEAVEKQQATEDDLIF